MVLAGVRGAAFLAEEGKRANGVCVDISTLTGQDTKSPTKCAARCRELANCGQSTFKASDGSCTLFGEASTNKPQFETAYNTSFCAADQESPMKLLRLVYAQAVQQCTWPGGDCTQTKCCNGMLCNWDYTKCSHYTCYKKDVTYSGCGTDKPPSDWDGYIMGGPRPLQEVVPAPQGANTQGTSLFCFTVVLWTAGATKAFYDSEADLANNQRKVGKGIMKCDDHFWVDGVQTSMAGWGSYSNIDAFIQMWEKVRADGRYVKHDWTVKVDADAVFFPDRLRMHIERARVPLGSRVYIRNNAFRFHFMGALEILSREAVELYFAKSKECSDNVGHQGGEDFYLRSCLDGIGVAHLTDYDALHDKYAAQNGCYDPWVAGFHFYKAVDKWNTCYNNALNTQKESAATEQTNANNAKGAAESHLAEAIKTEKAKQQEADAAAKNAKAHWDASAVAAATADRLRDAADKAKVALDKARATEKEVYNKKASAKHAVDAVHEVTSAEEAARASSEEAVNAARGAIGADDATVGMEGIAVAMAEAAADKEAEMVAADKKVWSKVQDASDGAYEVAGDEADAASAATKAASLAHAKAVDEATAAKEAADSAKAVADDAQAASEKAKGAHKWSKDELKKAYAAKGAAEWRKQQADKAKTAVDKETPISA